MKEKKTELYRTKDGVNIELNYIRNLGWFIEIEILCLKKDVIKSRKKILELREILNIKEREIERKGYTKELWNLKKRK
jgi:predicted adenylyl cyclase CyaB